MNNLCACIGHITADHGLKVEKRAGCVSLVQVAMHGRTIHTWHCFHLIYTLNAIVLTLSLLPVGAVLS